MKKKKEIIETVEENKKAKYIGAKYTGPDGLTFEWGTLTKGEIYDIIKEEIALKNKNIFEAVYS